MKPRDYQIKMCEGVLDQILNGSRKTLAVAPTGTGKSLSMALIANGWKKGRVLIVGHREELNFQNAETTHRISGEYPDIEMGDLRAQSHGLLSRSNIVVASIQTLNAGRKCKACDGDGCGLCVDGVVRRMQRFDPHEFGLMIIDEAHHATAASYRRLFRYFDRNEKVRSAGFTATPDRTDEVALGNIFDSVAFEYGLLDAIDDGWLVPINQEFIHCKDLDFSHVRKTAGDLNIGDLEDVLIEEGPLHEMVEPTVEIAGDRPTLIFAASVAHARLMANIINRPELKPNSAICITGSTPTDERRDLLRRYKEGEFQFLVGCGVFLEGFDEPRIEIVAMARPTSSRSLFSQMVGRGTRPISPPMEETADERKATIADSRKPSLLVLDYVGNTGKHKLMSTADILGGEYEDEVIQRATDRAKASPREEVDMRAILEAEQAKLIDEKKRERVVAKATYSRQSVDPFDLLDVAPLREPGWHKGRKPTKKMREMLAKAGVPNVGRMSFWDAKRLIGTMCERRENALCTYKQAKLLARYGEDTEVGFKEASRVIDQIAKRGWTKR